MAKLRISARPTSGFGYCQPEQEVEVEVVPTQLLAEKAIAAAIPAPAPTLEQQQVVAVTPEYIHAVAVHAAIQARADSSPVGEAGAARPPEEAALLLEAVPSLLIPQLAPTAEPEPETPAPSSSSGNIIVGNPVE
jgi:hypothetical protein